MTKKKRKHQISGKPTETDSNRHCTSEPDYEPLPPNSVIICKVSSAKQKFRMVHMCVCKQRVSTKQKEHESQTFSWL